MSCGRQTSTLHRRRHAALWRREATATKAAAERGQRGQRKAQPEERLGEKMEMTSRVVVSGDGGRGWGRGDRCRRRRRRCPVGAGQSGQGMSPKNDGPTGGQQQLTTVDKIYGRQGGGQPRAKKQGMELEISGEKKIWNQVVDKNSER